MGPNGREVEKGEHVIVFQANTAVGSRFSDLILGMGPMKVDKAAIGICILLVEALKPEDAGQNRVIAFLALPNPARQTAFETGEKRGTFANFFADDEVTSRGPVRSFLESGTIGRGGNRGREDRFSLIADS